MSTFLRHRKLLVPLRVMSEWIRLPTFLFQQVRINVAARESVTVQKLVDRLYAEKVFGVLPGGGRLNQGFADALARMKARRAEAVRTIEKELGNLNARMFQRLGGVLDNTALVEAAILNEVSEDMVWQSALPGYRAWSRERERKLREPPEKIVDWSAGGEARLNGQNELWEDELGTLRAVLTDTCESRQEYMRQRMTRGKKEKR